MKFFLPELYLRLNSPDEEIADAAEAALDSAGDHYRRHWASIKPMLPPSAIEFGEKLSLHDADVWAPAVFSPAPGRGDVADELPWWPLLLPRKYATPYPAETRHVVIVARQKTTLYADYLETQVFLHYLVDELPRVTATDSFAKAFPAAGRAHWLYDEFDVLEPNLFAHSILLSDGRVIDVPFRFFAWHVAKEIGCGAAVASARADGGSKLRLGE